MLLLLPLPQQRSRQKVKQPVQMKVPKGGVLVDDLRTPMEVSVAIMEARDVAAEVEVPIAVVRVADPTEAKDQPTLQTSLSTDLTTTTIFLGKRRAERLPRPLTTSIRGVPSEELIVAIAPAVTQNGAEDAVAIAETQNGVVVEAIGVDAVVATNAIGRRPGLMSQTMM